MKRLINTKRLIFYAWMGAGYALLSMLSSYTGLPGTFLQKILNNIWLCIYIIVINYIFFEFAVPYVLRKRKNFFNNILPALAMLVLFLPIYSYGTYLWRSFGMIPGIYTGLKTFTTKGHAISNYFGYSLGGIFFFGIIRHIYNYIKLKQASQQLLIEKQAAELNYLRSQTNPHFLFNTLNNIYSLARDKSDLAPESILRLSKILRFMLYETGGEYIAIGQEIKIMNDYIALEKLRYDESLIINFNHDVEDMRQALPPLLLIPLVENAFKHGVSETRDQPFVDIHLSVNKRQLTFTVKNSSETFADRNVKENIGLSNLRRQLELLYTEYHLAIQQNQAMFTTILNINLASHV